MEFALNNAPESTMLEITKNLFNKKFLSNIEFTIEDKVIFAHSHELMKRSVIFQKQLEPLLTQQQNILIKNFTYKSFYEFIRFIYTEECDINIENGIELFKLATQFKVLKLENQVLDYLLQRGVPLRTRLTLYALCIMEKYELPYNVIKTDIARNLNMVMELDNFTLIDPIVMEDILKLDCVDENIKEVQIFNGLIRWMNTYCENHQIDLKQRRQKFENLLQLIRYPHMTMEEFRGSVLNNCDLFRDSDLCAMFKTPTPSPKLRKSCDKKYDRRNIMNNNTKSETKFSVNQEVLFTGFRYGAGGNHEIKITGKNLVTNNIDVIKFNKKFKDDSIYKTISLGESLIFKPNTEYIIQISYDNGGYTCWCATYRMTSIIIHDSLNAVDILQPGTTMFEMFFKPLISIQNSVPTMDSNKCADLSDISTDILESQQNQTIIASPTMKTSLESRNTETLPESSAEVSSNTAQGDKCFESSSFKICEESTKGECCEPPLVKTFQRDFVTRQPLETETYQPKNDKSSELVSGERDINDSHDVKKFEFSQNNTLTAPTQSENLNTGTNSELSQFETKPPLALICSEALLSDLSSKLSKGESRLESPLSNSNIECSTQDNIYAELYSDPQQLEKSSKSQLSGKSRQNGTFSETSRLKTDSDTKLNSETSQTIKN